MSTSEVAALYARVSTSNQEEEATIESQVAAIETYIHEQGYILTDDHRYLDQAISGAYLARPKLDQLRHQVTDGLISVVVCYSPDRLARNYAHQLVLLSELKRCGVRIEFVNQPPLADTPQGQLLLSIQGVFAEYERELIKERLRLGRLHKLRSGQCMPTTAPYGYHYILIDQPNGGQWMINETEAEVVRDIFAWYIGSEKLSIYQLQARLNQIYPHVLRRATRWQISVVRAILRQTAYIGYSYANRVRRLPDTLGTRRKTGHGIRQSVMVEERPSTEWIKLTTPRIIDDATWHSAQERSKMNKKFAARNNQTHFYLLRGLLVCGECGYTMQGQTVKGYQSYYCTYGGRKRYPHVPHHSNRLAASILEPLVWDAVCQLLRDPQRIKMAWENEAQDTQSTDRLESEAQRLSRRQKQFDQQWKRLLDAYQEELLSKEELSDRKQKIDQERQYIDDRLNAIQKMQLKRTKQDQVIQAFSTLCEHVQHALENPTPETKQEILRLLVEKVIVEEDALTIKHIIPDLPEYRLSSCGQYG